MNRKEINLTNYACLYDRAGECVFCATLQACRDESTVDGLIRLLRLAGVVVNKKDGRAMASYSRNTKDQILSSNDVRGFVYKVEELEVGYPTNSYHVVTSDAGQKWSSSLSGIMPGDTKSEYFLYKEVKKGGVFGTGGVRHVRVDSENPITYPAQIHALLGTYKNKKTEVNTQLRAAGLWYKGNSSNNKTGRGYTWEDASRAAKSKGVRVFFKKVQYIIMGKRSDKEESEA